MYPIKSFLLLICFLLLQINVHSTIRYVKAGNPTPIAPYTSWATASDSIQKCINVCVPGDTVYVGNGVYRERVILKVGLSFIGSGIDSCVIDTRNFPWIGYNQASLTAADSCKISGFQITVSSDNSNIGVIYDKFLSPPMVGIFENNKIVNAAAGIGIFNTKVTIRNNLIINCNRGIDYDRGLPYIHDNVLSELGYLGISGKIDGYGTVINNILIPKYSSNVFIGITRNLSEKNYYSNNLILASQTGYLGVDSYRDTVLNNVISGGFRESIFLMGGSDVRNNIITWGKLAIRLNTPNTDSIKFNNVWDIPIIAQGGALDSTNISKFPMFADPDNKDYHLQKYSPMIDAGDPGINDLDGTRSDIGAYGGIYGAVYPYADLPPRPPRGLKITRSGKRVTLSWIQNYETDFHNYSVYMDSVPGFIHGVTNLVDTLSLSDSLTITIPPVFSKLYFKITATDNQGNTSIPSEEAYIILTEVKDGETAQQDYNLFHNYPDPFAYSTTIGYKLKEEGYVKLNVYDIRGELIQTLVNEVQSAGYHEIIYNSKSQITDNQNTLASGIYIYRIDIIGRNNIPVYSMTKKMVHIK